MKTFNHWAKRAAGDRPKPMTEVSVIYLRPAGKSIVVTDGTKVEHIDKATGEVTERQAETMLPVSQISFEEVDSAAELVRGKVYTMRLPEWLATDRGLA